MKDFQSLFNSGTLYVMKAIGDGRKMIVKQSNIDLFLNGIQQDAVQKDIKEMHLQDACICKNELIRGTS
jgi:hypothetical protein